MTGPVVIKIVMYWFKQTNYLSIYLLWRNSFIKAIIELREDTTTHMYTSMTF